MTFAKDIRHQYNSKFPLQLEQELQFAKLIVNHATDAVFWLGQDAHFFYVNDRACHLLEYTSQELLSLTMYDVALMSAEVWSAWWRKLQCNGSLSFESQYRTKSGRLLPMEITLTYGLYHDQEISCIFAREKTTEVELRSSLEQEKKYSKFRAQLLYMLAHELRTPLNMISFSTSLLKRQSHKWTEEKKRLYFERIQTTVEQLSHMLDKFLLFGTAEAGKLAFEPISLDLHQFCDDLVAQMQLMSKRSHNITFVSQGNYPTAQMDNKLLLPMLMNLLDNAIKYSPTGSTIELQLACEDRDVIFQVKDAGIGIPAADKQRLFEPFQRGSNVRDLPGTGLGLAFVKKLVDLHHGQIAVASEVGVGTTFTIRLPRAIAIEVRNDD